MRTCAAPISPFASLTLDAESHSTHKDALTLPMHERGREIVSEDIARVVDTAASTFLSRITQVQQSMSWRIWSSLAVLRLSIAMVFASCCRVGVTLPRRWRRTRRGDPSNRSPSRRCRASRPLPGSWQPLRYWELDELGLACLSKISAVHVTRCPAASSCE
jgi:hypothetical protein